MKEMITGKGGRSRRKQEKNRRISWPQIRAEQRGESNLTPYGGLAAAVMLIRGLDLPAEIDGKLSLLKQKHGSSESDHVLTLVLSALCGGKRLESINDLRDSGGTCRLTGLEGLSAASTVGESLHRFDEQDIWRFQEVTLNSCARVWEQTHGRRKRGSVCTIDTDSTMKELYGDCFEGADFNYRGIYGYHPELVTLAETGEVLMVENRPGNAKSGQGAEKLLERVYPTVQEHFERIRHRGDSKYGIRRIIETDESHGVTFYLGYSAHKCLIEKAEDIEESAWREMPLQPAEKRRKRLSRKKRARQQRHRRRKVTERSYRDKRTVSRQVSEFSYTPSWSDKAYRMVVVRSKREIHKGTEYLFDMYEYYFIITNDRRRSAASVACFYYQRDNQENIIKQLKHETGALWMPSKTLLANWAWMAIHALAWNMKSWICQLGFRQGLRWMWHHFCRDVMLITGSVIRTGRCVKLWVNDSHRYGQELVSLIDRFACLEFT